MSVRRPDLDGLDQEIQDHLEAETRDNVARGMSEPEARAAALRKFGNVTRVKEDVREVWFPFWLDSLRQDLRDAYRQLRRGPAFALAVVVTLTLGIGLTTAIYSVVHAVLLRPLNYAHPERMVWLTTQGKDGRSGIINSIDFARWQPQATSLAHIIAYGSVDSTMVVGGEAWRVRILSASDGLWQVTGAEPLLGTLPAASDTQSLAITHRTFREHFQGDPNIIGRAVSVDGRQATIAAVLPPDFNPQLPMFAPMLEVDATEPAAYRMMRVDPPPQVITRTTGVRIYQAIGELKPGVTVEQARAELEAIHTREQRDHPMGFPDSAAVMMPLRDHIVGPSRLALGVLLAASIVVLLITCANVANLLLSRVAARRKEIALRMAIGSGPLRVGRQLRVESLA